MYSSIGVYDWQTVLAFMETLAWVLFVGAGVWYFTQKKSLEQKSKQIIILLFAAWAVVSVCLVTIKTFDYFSNQREFLKKSIETQNQIYDQAE